MKNRISVLWSIAALLIVSALILAGCSVATNDSTSDKGPMKLTLPEEACLKDAIPVVENYFQGAATANDTNVAFNCISGALVKFTTSTRGANPDYFTSRELRTFLETYYLGDIKVSDQLLIEIMRVKQLVVGGSDDRLTKAELSGAATVVETLRTEALHLLPYVRYISQGVTQADASKNPAEVEAAISALTSTMSNIGSLLGKGTEPYSTDDLESLLEELKPIFKDWKGPAQALTYLPTFTVIKGLILNPPGDRVTPAEWPALLNYAGRVYALYMRAHYLMDNTDLMIGTGLDQVSKAWEEVTSLITAGINAKPTKVIAYTQMDAAIDELIRLNFVDERLRDTTLKGAVRTLFAKFLNPASSGARPKITGLTLPIMARVHDEGASFIEMQRVYTKIMGSRTTPMALNDFTAIFSTTMTTAVSAQDDLKKLFTLASPLSFRDNGTVIFDNRRPQLLVSEKAFVRYNWQAIAARLLVQGYATDAVSNRWTGLTLTQFKAFFTDVHDLGADMEILEPKDDDLWQTSFNESNMFMLSAVNDPYMSYSEIFDYIAYLLGGGVMSDRGYADVKERCAHIGVDAFNRPTMDISCFRQRYGQQFSTVNAELPGWTAAVAKAGPSGWPAIEQSLEAAARTGGYNDDPISSSDLTRMTMVQQYIESLFVRYDADRSGKIDYTEAINALPLFKQLLITASGFTSEKKITALYMWILDKGKAPTSVGDKIGFLIWSIQPSQWKAVKADRLKLLSVVGALKSAAAAPAATAASLSEFPSGSELIQFSPLSQ